MVRRPLRWKVLSSRLSCSTDERGVALIEFALVLPLLLLLLLGMIDAGKAFNYWNDETHLANEAARYAVVDSSPDPNWAGSPTTTAYKLNTAIKNQADSNELKNGGTSSIPSAVNICIWFPNKHNPLQPAVDFAPGQPVQVVVTAQYNWLGYLVGKGVLPSSNLRATSTMRLEQTYKANGTDAYNTGTAGTATDGSGTC